MIVSVVIAIIVIGVTLNKYLTGTVLKSTLMLIASICGMILAFTYYEMLGDFILSKGYGGTWALPGALAIIYIISFAVIFAAFSALTGHDIHFSHLPDKIIVCACGAFTALIFCGIILIALSMSPIPSKWLYSQYDSEDFSLDTPSGTLIPADSLVAGLFKTFSNGSMRSGKSFAVMHPNLISEIHLNKLHSSEGVLSIAAKDCIIVNKNGVWTPTETYKDAATGEVIIREMIIVRVGIKSGSFADGGATDEEGNFIFTLAQFQMITVDNSAAAPDKKFGTSSALPLYPVGYIKAKGVLQEMAISEPITMGRADFRQQEDYGNVLLIDLVFQQTKYSTPIALKFRNNVIVELPKVVQEDPNASSTIFVQKSACISDVADIVPVSGTKITPLQIAAGDKLMKGIQFTSGISRLWEFGYSSTTDTEPQMDKEKIYNAKLKFSPMAADIEGIDNERINQAGVPNMLSMISNYTLVSLKCQMASTSVVDSPEFPVLIDTQGKEHYPAGVFAGGTKDSEHIYQLDYCSDLAVLPVEKGRITSSFTSQLWLGGQTDKITELYFFYQIPAAPESTIIAFVRINGKDTGISKYEGFLCEK